MNDSDWFRVEERPWTKNSIHQLKHAIMNGNSQTDILSYKDVSLWYGQALVLITNQIRSGLSQTEHTDISISSRVKTIDTLRAKLLRQPNYSINRIHDVMGVRIVADMTLNTQDEVAQQICRLFDNTQILDLRDDSHSGYRAMHVAIILPGSVCAEIQVRTTLQDEWANCYELAADIFGREIRYGYYPSDKTQNEIVRVLQDLSNNEIKDFENMNKRFAEIKTQAAEIFEQLRRVENIDKRVIDLRNQLLNEIIDGTRITDKRQKKLKNTIQNFRNTLETYSGEGK